MRPPRGRERADSPVLVRYADDFVVMCHTRDRPNRSSTDWVSGCATRARVQRGEDQSSTSSEGFDFLGFNIRRYRRQAAHQAEPGGREADPEAARRGGALPRGSQRHRGDPPAEPDRSGLGRLLPECGLQRGVLRVDHHLWSASTGGRCAPTRTSRAVGRSRYFGRFNPSRQDRWVFGDRDSGTYLRQFAWTKIVRHKMVMGTASPDDPALDRYWASRRRKSYALFGGATASLLIRQQGLCPACGTSCCTPITVRSPRTSGNSGPGP